MNRNTFMKLSTSGSLHDVGVARAFEPSAVEKTKTKISKEFFNVILME